MTRPASVGFANGVLPETTAQLATAQLARM